MEMICRDFGSFRNTQVKLTIIINQKLPALLLLLLTLMMMAPGQIASIWDKYQRKINPYIIKANLGARLFPAVAV